MQGFKKEKMQAEVKGKEDISALSVFKADRILQQPDDNNLSLVATKQACLYGHASNKKHIQCL